MTSLLLSTTIRQLTLPALAASKSPLDKTGIPMNRLLSISEFKQSTTPAEKDILKATLATIDPFTNIRSTMPVQYIVAFLLVAIDEGQSVTEYARRAGINPSLMTRHLSDIGEVNRDHDEGFGLVELETDLMDRRFKKVKLSVKGRGVVAKIVRALK
jgi:DNA-binding MarR family transcriptional regulator